MSEDQRPQTTAPTDADAPHADSEVQADAGSDRVPEAPASDSATSDGPADGPRTAAARDAPEDPSKRRFIAAATHALGACVTCAVAVPALSVVLHPVLDGDDDEEQEERRFLAVAPVDRFSAGGPFVRVVVKDDRKDAWLSHRGVPVGSILVRRESDGKFRVFSAKCPHLGCAVNPVASGGFACPCHNSAFGPDGEKRDKDTGEANPAPRGLDLLEWPAALASHTSSAARCCSPSRFRSSPG